MSTPLTAEYLNETAAKRFGKRLRLESFSTEQLYDARNKLRTKLYQAQTNENYNHLDKDDSYHRNSMFLDIINAEINERENNTICDNTSNTSYKKKSSKMKNESAVKHKKRVVENTEDEAELIMAAKDMVDKLTGWMEHTAQMQSETILSLGDAIRIEKGSGYSRRFVKIVKPALAEMYSSMEETRQKLISGVELLSGEKEYDMGDEPIDDVDAVDDDFGASEVSKGGKRSEGRVKRESFDAKLQKYFIMLDEKKNYGKMI